MEVFQWIKAAQKGDKEARDTIIEKNTGLVWSIVRRFSNRGYDLEDLFQIGCIGLIKAIDNLDLTLNSTHHSLYRFIIYNIMLIIFQIIMFIFREK